MSNQMRNDFILQKIIFPLADVCREKELYFKGRGITIAEDRIEFLNEGGVLNASTYFNSFSWNKWTKYTDIDNLSINLTLQGSFIVRLKALELKNGKATVNLLNEFEINCPKKETVSFDFGEEVSSVVFWELQAVSCNAIFFGGEYITDLRGMKVNDISLAIGICTYKREEFVVANLNRLSKAIHDKDNLLYNRVKVYVSDNGQTLGDYNIQDDAIKIVYNKNLGGAGGFTRCLIESQKDTQEQFTNFLFLDDDIILNISAVEKMISLLSLLSQEHLNSVIGGAMFSTDMPYLQFENASKWSSGFIFNRRDIDMRDNLNILLNEQSYDVNYNAWCYCCIPYDIVSSINLPLPIFFHMDDVEYGLRNGLKIITLNGINVWHLYKKALVNAKNDYYDIRNKLIMESEINPKAVRSLAHCYLNSFTKEALKYHYARSINALDGILDFCKGFDWFKSLDTIKKHGELFNNTVWQDSTEALKHDAKVSLVANVPERSRKYMLKVAMRTVLFSHGSPRVVFNDNSIEDIIGRKGVVVYVPSENKYISYKKNIFLAIKCFIKHCKVARLLKSKKFDKIVEEYHNRITEVQSLDFWEKYLDIQDNNSKKRKVLFIASDNDATSGAFRSMVALNEILRDKYNINTCVVLPKQGDGVSLLKEAKINYTVIPSEDWVVRLNESKINIRKKKKSVSKLNGNAILSLENFIKKEKFDLVHINTSYSYVGAVAANRCHVPVVWHIREFLEEDQERRMLNRQYGYSLMRKVDAVVAISNSIEEKYVKLLRTENIRQIYNGVHVNKFYDSEKTIFNSEKIIFICVGTIMAYKGQLDLILAISKLMQQGFENFEVWLVGNTGSDYAKQIEYTASVNGFSDRLKFWGRRQDVDKLFRLADIACVCSRSEAFGRITVEAMLSGNLVIGANTAGTKELINDGIDGLLFEAQDVDSLCDKIKYALNNKAEMQMIANNGRDKAKTEFSAERNADEVYKLYQEVLEKQ